MNTFTPMKGYVEVEPLSAESFLAKADNEKTFIEAAKVIKTDGGIESDNLRLPQTGDIIFFRPHGFFETPEYEGKKHYVVRVSEEFILGKLTPNVGEK